MDKRNGEFRWASMRDGRNKTIAAAGESFNVARPFRVVPERRSDLIHAKIDAALVVYKRVVAPEAMLNLFTGNDLSRAIYKQQKYSERLRMNLY
jgi:hypothetical protein